MKYPFFFFAYRLGRLWFQEDLTLTPKKFLLPADYVELLHSQTKLEIFLLLLIFFFLMSWIFLRAVIYRLRTRRWGKPPSLTVLNLHPSSFSTLSVLRADYLKQ